MIAPSAIRPPGVPAALARAAHEAGHVRIGDKPVTELLPRQAVFELVPRAGQTHAVTPLTDAARAALATPGNRVETFLSSWAGMVDAAGGARLKIVALSDSPEGMRLVDNLAVLEGGLGINTIGPDRLGQYLEQLGTQTNRNPAAHQVSNSTRVGPHDPLEAWIVVGPDTSADVLHFTGARPQLHESWPAEVRNGARGSESHQKIAAFAASVLAHEGTHAKLTRREDGKLGTSFPAKLDEARTEYVNALSSDGADLAHILAGPDAAARVGKALAARPYGDLVTWLQQRLDQAGVPSEPSARQQMLASTPLAQLRELVGEPS